MRANRGTGTTTQAVHNKGSKYFDVRMEAAKKTANSKKGNSRR
jgi:hypothetical protein